MWRWPEAEGRVEEPLGAGTPVGRAYEAWAVALAAGAGDARINAVLLSTVPSTSGLARAIVADYLDDDRLPRRALLAAWEQTAGRGRRGRSWASPAGRGVYATWIEPLADRELRQRLPLTVSIALAEGIGELTGAPCAVKWPNDLMMEEERKIGGILIDVVDRRGVGAVALIGFGINHDHARSELPDRPVATLTDFAAAPGLGEAGRLLVARLARTLEEPPENDDLLRRYRELSVHHPGDPLSVQVGDEHLEGTFAGFDALGRLRLEVAGEERLVASGEVFNP